MARAQRAQPWCNEPRLNTISDTDSVIAAEEMEQNSGYRSQNDKSTGRRVGDSWVIKLQYFWSGLEVKQRAEAVALIRFQISTCLQYITQIRLFSDGEYICIHAISLQLGSKRSDPEKLFLIILLSETRAKE